MVKTEKLRQWINVATVAAALTMAFLLEGCKDDDDKVPTGFSINKEAFSFPENGGVGEIRVTAGQEWTAATNAEWCMVTPANGDSDAVCEIRVDSSYLYESREAVITFYSGNAEQQVKIDQFGYKKEIRLSDSIIEIPDYSAWGTTNFEVTVTSNVEYEIVIPEESTWLTCKQPEFEAISIPRPLKVKFDYQNNIKPEERVVTVEWRAIGEHAGEAEPVVLKVKQGAAPYIQKGTRRGDSLALIAIARGLNCGTNWDLSRSIMTWSGVETEEITYQDQNGNDSTDLRVIGARFSMIATKTSVPFEVTYLTECKTLVFMANENGYRQRIHLGPEITTLPKLKSLSFMGYGICALPEEMANMTALEELELGGNTFTEIPMDVISSIPNLNYLSFSGNRRVDAVMDLSNEKRDSIGLTGALPEELFKLKKLKYLSLSYNYFEGSIPDIPLEEVADFEYLALNLNRLTGKIPDWILQHPNLGCWNPYILVFNQEGKDSRGKAAGFDQEPPTSSIPACPLYNKEDEEETYILNPDLEPWNYMDAEPLSLRGNWRIQRMYGKKAAESLGR